MKKEPDMTMKLAAWLCGISLYLAAGMAPAHDHDHEHGGDAPAQLALNNGKKWPTDDALRAGMGRIRDAAGQEAQFAPAELAKRIDGEIAMLVQNCKLDKETDAMLHLVLADLIAGAEILRERPLARREAMERITRGLQGYGTYFEHPGW